MTALLLNAELFRELSIIAEDETEYIMSSPAMVEILRQGEEDIKNGRGRVIKIEDLWK